MQTEGKAKSYYKGTFDCFMKMLRTEGIRGLYHGFNITILRDVPGFCAYFGIYGISKDYLSDEEGKCSLPRLILAGGTAGVLSWIINYPVDVVKTNIQKDTVKKTILQMTRELYLKGGLAYFYRGLKASVIRAFIVNATIFVLYEEMIKNLKHINNIF
eukprot:TRINITY_DN4000_c0_g1_i2.p1 TRINITY_DN4000_c0_g1~~TRINITY_DN4000_c0_g1_i2.p1  ORF type:complete len:158 (-),score=12.76 TRINITY_DN4000_c0_g1_i2:49-522(-)